MNASLTLIGYWIEVSGQLLSALLETKNYIQIGGDPNLYLSASGKGLQSLGEFIQGMDGDNNDAVLASYIESAGAGASTYGVWNQIRTGSDGSNDSIIILGDGLQGAGAALAAVVEDDDVLKFGNWLESMGATLEAVGGTIYLKGQEKKGIQLTVLGSWLQVLGGASSLIYLTMNTDQ